MHESYDFTWEREWRVVGDLAFTRDDIVCLILPADKEERFKAKAAEYGIPVISPGWTYEQIVSAMASQQRATKEIVGAELEKLKAERKAEEVEAERMHAEADAMDPR